MTSSLAPDAPWVDGLRMNPQRLSHLRAVVEELSLTLEEMADMDEARRALAHDHEKEARRLVLQAADLAGFTVTATP